MGFSCLFWRNETMLDKWENGPHLDWPCPITQFSSRHFAVRPISFFLPPILATAPMVANTRENGLYQTRSRPRAASAPSLQRYIPTSPAPNSAPPSLCTASSSVVPAILRMVSAGGNSYSQRSARRLSERRRLFFASHYHQLDVAYFLRRHIRSVSIFFVLNAVVYIVYM